MTGKDYDKIQMVLDKILNEVNELMHNRDDEITQNIKVKWTNVEVAQLLIAVFNLGDGEWPEIQKRINFTTSEQVKTPNQVAYKWR